MAIKFKGRTLERETVFDSSKINGTLGAMVNAFFGGPRIVEVTAYPKEEKVEVITSYGSYCLKGQEINSNPLLVRMGLRYQSF